MTCLENLDQLRRKSSKICKIMGKRSKSKGKASASGVKPYTGPAESDDEQDNEKSNVEAALRFERGEVVGYCRCCIHVIRSRDLVKDKAGDI